MAKDYPKPYQRVKNRKPRTKNIYPEPVEGTNKKMNQKILGLFVKTNGVLSKPLFGGIAHIFMLHRVLPATQRDEYTFNKDLAISTEFLEKTILDLKHKGYQFISLDELYQILQTGKKPKRPCICITLDDGYRDNVTHGLPIFQKHQIPFTLYVTNSFPNRTAHYWWYWLENEVLKNTELTWENIPYELVALEQKKEAYNFFRPKFKNSNHVQRTKMIESFLQIAPEQIKIEGDQFALSWNEIKELSKEKLATIGAHTMHHVSLSHLSEEEMEWEIKTSKEEIEQYINKEVVHFSYPYGGLEDAGKREYTIAKKLGFHTATLNHPGNVFMQHKNNSWTLPRYALGDSVSQERITHSLNGIRHYAVNGWKKIIK